MKQFLTLVFILFGFTLVGQVNMQNGSSTTCSETFFDSGGSGDVYGLSDYTYTFSPLNVGDKVSISFSSFDVEDGWDYLYVYDGPNTSSPLIASLTGTSIPADITSTATGGELTFFFDQDDFVATDGWEATISCVTPSAPSAPSNLSFFPKSASSIEVSWDPSNSNGSPVTNYTLEYKEDGAGTYTPVSVGTSTTYEVTGLTSGQLYNFRVKATNSLGDSPYSLVTDYSIADQDIDIIIDGVSLSSGGSFNFGSVMVGYPVQTTITIKNTGGLNLNLDGTDALQISGTNSSEFINDGDSTGSDLISEEFIVVDLTFSPTSAGAKTATVNIYSNDPDEDPFTLTVNGTAVAKSADCTIPGGDFETSSKHSTPILDFFSGDVTGVIDYEAPTAWDGLASKAFAAFFGTNINVELSTDANSGTNAVRVFNDGAGVGDLSTGVKCESTYTNLKGYYKFNDGIGLDSAIIAISTGGYGSITDANADTFYITSNQATYTEFTLPLAYDANSNDSLAIYIAVTTNGDNAELLVDDLTLDGLVTNPFTSIWITDNTQITIPENPDPTYTYNYDVSWTNLTQTGVGDGSTTGQTGSYTITGLTNGDEYLVEISGDFPAIYFNNTGDKSKIQSIESWGDISWETMYRSFYGCNNLRINAVDQPDLSLVTDMSYMFYNADALDDPIGHWDVSNVEDMTYLFAGADNFSQNITTWDVGNVSLMNGMLQSTPNFDYDLGGWDISSVTSMSFMLDLAGLSPENYDNTLIGWAAQTPQSNVNLGAVAQLYCDGLAARTTLEETYNWNIEFDQQACEITVPFITVWQTNNIGGTPNNQIEIPIYNVADNFYDYDIYWEEVGNSGNNGTLLNQNSNAIITFPAAGTYEVHITGYFPQIRFNGAQDPRKLLEVKQWGDNVWKSFSSAFQLCQEMNITATDVPDLSIVTSMQSMFEGCTDLDADLSSWDVSNVISMRLMFANADSFNSDITGWDVSGVKNMTFMFSNNDIFNQNIGLWTTTALEETGFMFSNAAAFNQDISSWNVSNVSDMTSMFSSAASFNQDLGDWNVSGVTNMSNMFNGSAMGLVNYERTLEGWAAQTLQNGVTLGATGLEYCVTTNRDILTNTPNDWTISGDTQFCAPFDGGDGTAEFPYEIANSTQLNEIRNFLDKYFVLTADIDLTSYNTGSGWEPIGISSSRFEGNIDGKGFTISNLTIARPTEDYVGLFGYINSNAVVTDINLTNVNVTGRNYVGALSGYSLSGSITENDVSGSITGTNYVGGLLGSGAASNSVVNASISGADYVGGIVGTAGGVSNSIFTGTVDGEQRVGGIIGNSAGAILNCDVDGIITGTVFTGGISGRHISQHIENCHVSGSVSGGPDTGGILGITFQTSVSVINCSTDATITGSSYTGGLIGRISQPIEEVTGSFTTGDVTGSSSVGGLVGYVNNTPISNSYSTANVTATSSSGGLVGIMENGTGSISNSYSVGKIVATGTTKRNGGLLSTSSATPTITSSYYNIETSCSGGDGTPLESSEMTSGANFTGWDFASTWAITEGSTYPYLQWQGSPASHNTPLTIPGPTPDVADLPDAEGECEVTSITAPIATSYCGQTITGTTDATFPITTNTTITWTFDDSGRESTQTQDVVMTGDVTDPVPTVTNLPTLTDQCSVSEPDAPTADDNCAGTITATTTQVFPITDQGTTTIIWEYDDGSGNIVTQEQDVIIEDITAPVPDAGSLVDLTGECSVAAPTPPTATDNCDGSGITGTPDVTFPVTAQGTTVVTWTFEDAVGNTSTQTQNVIIDDVTAPVADAGSLPDLTGECSVAAPMAPTATDNCDGSGIVGTADVTFPITAQGTTVVTWTFEDSQGNTSTQIQNVIIDDVTAPVADAGSLVDLTGECSVTAPTPPTATDNCDGSGITGTPDVTFPVTAQGTTVVTWTFEDSQGNTSTQTQNVIIDDVSAPVADAASLDDVTGVCSVDQPSAPTATDNCAGSISGTPDVTFPVTTVGTTTVTWTFDDGNGNTSTQTQDVIVNTQTWYADADEDGYGDVNTALVQCTQPVGYVANADDCDDSDIDINPETEWFRDSDEDGFGDPNDILIQCDQPVGYVQTEFDCDDTDASQNPLKFWYFDGDGDGYGTETDISMSCTQPSSDYIETSGDCDDSNASINPESIWYADTDGDGFGDPAVSQVACDQPVGYVLNSGDCDDTDETIVPDLVWYADTDSDGEGDPDNSQLSCTQPVGFVANDLDCDDTNSEINSSLVWYADTDGDGFGDPESSQTACEQPAGYVSDNTDCDDSDLNVTNSITWYADSDGDGLGDPDVIENACTQPEGYVLDNTDCDDSYFGDPEIEFLNELTGCGSITMEVAETFSTYTLDDGFSSVSVTNPFEITESGQYSLTVTTDNGCEVSRQFSVTIEQGLTVDLGSDRTICSGEILDPGAIGVSYLWSTGETTQSITPLESGIYSVEITNAEGCVGSDEVNITVNESPVLEIDDLTICLNSPWSITIPDGYSSYKWYYPTGGSTATQTISYSATSNAGEYQYVAEVTNANGCIARDTVIVTAIADIPPSNFMQASYLICRGDTINAPDGYELYEWSNGSIGQVFIPSESGNYTLSVTNSNGCTGSDIFTVNFYNSPSVNLGENRELCYGEVIAADEFDYSYLYNYSWSDGVEGYERAILEAGVYVVTVTDLSTGCINRDTAEFSVKDVDPIDLGPDIETCLETPFTLTLPDGYTNYRWISNGNLYPQQEITFRASEARVYTYIGAVDDINGCTLRDTINVTIHPEMSPVLNNFYSTYNFCGSGVIDAGEGFDSYLWSDGSTEQTLEVSEPGNYSVTVFNSYGCSTTAETSVTIREAPVVDAGPDLVLCLGQEYTLNVEGTFDTFAYWAKLNDTNHRTGALPLNRVADTPGEQGWIALVTNQNGCFTRDTVHITVYDDAIPTVSFPNQLDACEGTSIGATTENATSFLWSTGADSEQIQVFEPGNYSLTVFNDSGCSATDSVEVNILYNAISAFEYTVVEGEGIVNFTNLSEYASGFVWSFGDGTQSTQAEPEHQYPQSGEYIVSLIAESEECVNDESQQTLTLEFDKVLGLKDVDIRVYPSPAAKYVKLDHPTPELTHYSMVNTSGQEVLSGMLDQDGNTEIQLEKLPEGLYFFKLYGPEKSIIYRVVKNQ